MSKADPKRGDSQRVGMVDVVVTVDLTSFAHWFPYSNVSLRGRFSNHAIPSLTVGARF